MIESYRGCAQFGNECCLNNEVARKAPGDLDRRKRRKALHALGRLGLGGGLIRDERA
jgi:hypothetical protein